MTDRNAAERGMRVNEQIRISPVRVINAEGAMLGVMPTGKALEQAREAGLDLVEVAPNERPPVCKIMDYGKFKYSQKKKASKQKQHQVQVKEIRVRPKTGDHDIEVKIKRAREFLSHKDKVLVNVLFRGRELAHIDEGRRVMNEVLQALDDVAKLEKTPSMEGKRMTALIAPKGDQSSTAAPSPAPRPAAAAGPGPGPGAPPAPASAPGAPARVPPTGPRASLPPSGPGAPPPAPRREPSPLANGAPPSGPSRSD